MVTVIAVVLGGTYLSLALMVVAHGLVLRTAPSLLRQLGGKDAADISESRGSASSVSAPLAVVALMYATGAASAFGVTVLRGVAARVAIAPWAVLAAGLLGYAGALYGMAAGGLRQATLVLRFRMSVAMGANRAYDDAGEWTRDECTAVCAMGLYLIMLFVFAAAWLVFAVWPALMERVYGWFVGPLARQF